MNKNPESIQKGIEAMNKNTQDPFTKMAQDVSNDPKLNAELDTLMGKKGGRYMSRRRRRTTTKRRKSTRRRQTRRRRQ